MSLTKHSYKELFSQYLSQTDFAEYTKEVDIYCSPNMTVSSDMVINGVPFNFISAYSGSYVKVMVKFDGTVAYNITEYLNTYLLGNNDTTFIMPLSDRAREDLAIKFVATLRDALRDANNAVRFVMSNNDTYINSTNNFVSLKSKSRVNVLMRDAEYSVRGRIPVSEYTNLPKLYDALYALVVDGEIVVPDDSNAIEFVDNDNLFRYEDDNTMTAVYSENYGLIFVNDEVLNYIRYRMPDLYVYQCEQTNIYYTSANEYRNHGTLYSLIRHTTDFSQAAQELDGQSILPHLLNIAIVQDGYCSHCDTTLYTVGDHSLFQSLTNYTNLHNYLNVDEDNNYLCEDCGANRRYEQERYDNLVGHTHNSIVFNGNVYPRWVYDGGIEDYDYEPYFEMYGDGLHLGAEIEIDKGGEYNAAANIACNILTYDSKYFAYAMHDGSLNDGFEIGTMPATLAVHKEIAYKDAFQFLVSAGYRAHDTDTCGIHIHFDRDFLGATHRTINTKVAYLTYILEHNWGKVRQFTRRDYHELSRWAPKKDLIQDVYADDDEDDIINKFQDKYDHDKYVAVNTQHSNSIELRIFRGTLDYNSYMSILEFVDNLVHLTKGITNITQAQQVTFADIINYKPTEYLVGYCQERGII